MHGIGPASLVPALGHLYAGAPAQAPVPPDEPDVIFGTSSPGLLYWGRGDTVTESGGVVSGLPNKATFGPATLAQATSSKRPALVAVGGQPALHFDGVDDLLNGTLPGGGTAARCYSFLVARCHTLRGTVDYGCLAHNGSGGQLSPYRMLTTGFTGYVNSDGGDLITGPTLDTDVHVFEAGFSSTELGRYRVDGKTFLGRYTGGNSGIDQITIGAWGPAPNSNYAAIDVFEYGLLNKIPSAAELAKLDAYMRARYGVMLDSTLMLDKVSVAALCAHSTIRKQRAKWAGAALEVQKVSSGAIAAVTFTGANADTGIVSTHCAGSSGLLVNWCDQGPSGRHLNSLGTVAPRLYEAGALRKMSNGALAGYVPVAGTGDSLASAVNAHGLYGNPAWTIGIAFARATDEGRTFEYGAGSGTDSLLVDAEIGRGMFVANRSANRQLNYNTTAGLPHAMVIRKPAGGTIADVSILESGALLTQLAIVNPSTTFGFSNTSTRLVLWNLRGGTDSFAGYIACFFWFPAYFADGSTDLAALVAELEAHIAPVV